MSSESHDDKKCCHIDITINAQGDVHIYNCPPSQAPSPETSDECAGSLPVSPGACVPLALGAKPKQSQRKKLDRLLAGNPVPSTFAASFIHLSRRFLAGKTAANAFEQQMFDRFQALSPALRRTLSCTVDQFDAIPVGDRNRLFDTSLIADLNTPLDITQFSKSVLDEITVRVTQVSLGDPDCATETPGRIRVFDPGVGGEIFTSQVIICRINGLRTSQFQPSLSSGEFTSAELQQQCAPQVVNGELQVTCAPQVGNCPGHQWADGTCLRVQEVDAGASVVLEGVNFFSVDTRVRLRLKDSADLPIEVDAHVCGDEDTPVTEVIDGNTVLIADCRVHDRLTFRVPPDLAPGVYELNVVVPNITGIANLGTEIASTPEYICVMPPATARFRIEGDKMHCHRETWPASFGSDEVAIRFLTLGIFTDGTFGQLEHVESLFGDVDDGETRNLICVPLPEYSQPVQAVSILVLGYEVDNWATYEAQIHSFIDAYMLLLKQQWKLFLAEIGSLGLLGLIAAGSGWGFVAGAIISVLAMAADIFIALWAPADLIMQDLIVWSACDLAALTSDTHPAPALNPYTTAGGEIKVKVSAEEKGGGEYLERREYTCDDEESRYSITLRYSRVA
jgi:hypothetical protein